ncbi:MAG: transcriptional regulator, Fur family transcriptional regulator, ferric uptake regulator [Candidatus Saccharibacteria bacterium]|nr:transcriptional regulator, Fur family transcriptional regulator, ferric uptake regulator [Candidatus Saccharibacteria bacterium]
MPIDELAKLRLILKNQGHQITKAREATFRLLLHSEPQSLNEILMKADGQVDRVTIYRNIDLFEKLGIAHRIYIGWKYKIELSDEFTGHHHHLSCLRCGKVIDIEDETHIDEFIQDVAKKFGFQPRRHQFEVDGYCQDCQSNE